MRDVIEISYTGDLLGHRRCARAWCFEKQAGFHPYEQVQAMEGRLIHHAMEWLARFFKEHGSHPTKEALEAQLNGHFRVLWARGIRTAFASKKATIARVRDNLFPRGHSGSLHPTVRAAIEGARHTEYEIRTVRKLLRSDFGGKSRLLLTGILDLVVQQDYPLLYRRRWKWADLTTLVGYAVEEDVAAQRGDVEIWDYKGTRASTKYIADYVRQLLTYAALYRERAGALPRRCVLFFVNEKTATEQLLTIDVDDEIVEAALSWTIEQVKLIRRTTLQFQESPLSIEGGGIEDRDKPAGQRLTEDLKQQCTACGFRFDCQEYCAFLPGGAEHPDVRRTNVRKN